MDSKFHFLRAFSKRQINRKQRFLRNLIALLIIIIIIVLIVTISIITGARKERITTVMQKRMDQTLTDFKIPLELAKQNNLLLYKWGRTGAIDLEANVDEFDSSLIPLMEGSPYLDFLYISNRVDLHYSLFRSGSAWKGTKSVDLNTEDFLSELGVDPDKFRKDHLDFGIMDSITIRTDNFRWLLTDSENSLGTRLLLCYAELSISLSDSVNNPLLIISGINIDKLIADISGRGYRDKGKLTIISDLSRIKPTGVQDNTSVRNESITDSVRSENDLFDLALQYWLNSKVVDGPYLFRHENSNWWGLLDRIELRSAPFVFLAIQPEDDIMQDIIQEMKRERYLYGLVGLIIILISMIIILIGIRGYNRIPGDFSSEISMGGIDLDGLIATGESEILEFKSTLRWNLKTNKPDREIELAVMKTIVAFLNSEGGILLVGIADGGKAVGIGADGFSSNDKFLLHFNNLIKNHIGLEFASLIDFEICDYKGKQILIVRCEKFSESMFLRHEENEDFYIRVGPGSRKLSTKKAIKYISSRKE